MFGNTFKSNGSKYGNLKMNVVSTDEIAMPIKKEMQKETKEYTEIIVQDSTNQQNPSDKKHSYCKSTPKNRV